MSLRSMLSLASALVLIATTASAAVLPGFLPQRTGQPETINGIAIRPGVERLSYISSRYYGIRPAYDACLKQGQGAIPAQQDCADAELAYQDARLNRAYKALLANLDNLDRRAAVEAQRAWLSFRDKDCAARAGRFGSNAGPATASVCRMESTALRAQQLEDWRTSLTSSTVSQNPGFSGHWLYSQSCGYKSSVDHYLTQIGSDVSGHWGEGTRISGSSGNVKGKVDHHQLDLQYCEGDDRAGYTKCPAYDPKSTDRFILHGDELTRYRGRGMGAKRTFEKDVVLHRVVQGKPTIEDNRCQPIETAALAAALEEQIKQWPQSGPHIRP